MINFINTTSSFIVILENQRILLLSHYFLAIQVILTFLGFTIAAAMLVTIALVVVPLVIIVLYAKQSINC